ncbi:AAA family ATPase [Vulgatibacter sp.]|uniref:AAA family ATPase n=1 Tax=Vulgatibacter sp. TaxID=1971226 RepID=UPI00356202B2
MKILAIRGENLASLEGAFAVDFTAAPLDRAGLFAITGPTGAGKTTLLDALCLALFGTTPRIASVTGRGHEVGRAEDGQRIQNTDARSILRRGAGAGHAEVEFVGRDGSRYRARWTARRARGRADGNLQTVNHELWDSEGTAIGRVLTEVRAEIRNRVGLDYEQFCRSVLLAQGEFAAFLRADEKKRAELLEAVTGTAIYRELSVKAHERFAAAKQALAALRIEHGALPVLDAEARAALEAELREREVAFGAARAALEAAGEAVRWYRTQEASVAAEAAAAAALREAESAWEAAAPGREALRQVEEVAELRPLVHGADEAARRSEAAAGLLAQAEAEAAAAAGAIEGAAAEVAAAAERERAEAAAREVLGPQIEEARQRDVEITAAEKRRSEAGDEARRLEARLVELRGRLEQLQGEEASLREQLEGIEAFRLAEVCWEPVAAQWERWQATLERAAGLDAERRAGLAALPALEQAAADAAAALERSVAAREAAQAQVDAAEAALQQAEGAAPAEALAAVRAHGRAWEEEAAQARLLEGLCAEASRVDAARGSAAAQEKAAASDGAGLEAERAAADGERASIEEELALARTALDGARAMLDLEGRREELVPGKPCPLCGSEAHPFAAEAPPAAGLVRSWQERVGGLQARLTTCERRLGELVGRIAAAATRGQQAARERAAHEGTLLQLEERWRGAAALSPRDLGSGGAASARSAIEAWLAELAARRQELQAREAAAVAAEEAQRRAREVLEGVRRRREAALEAQRLAEATKEREERALAERREALARQGEELARLRAELSEPFARVDGWEAAFVAAPGELAALAARQVAAWRGRETERLAISGRLTVVGAERGPAAAQVAEAQAQAEAGQVLLEARTTELEGLRARRRELLGGEAVAAVEERLRRVAAGCVQALEAARRREAELRQRAAAAGARAESALQQVAAERQGAADAAAAVAAAAAARQLEVAEVRRRLALPAAEVARWREEAERLSSLRAQAQGRFEERRAQRLAHEETGAPAVQREAAEEARALAEAEHKAAEAAFYGSRSKRERDDEARAQSAAFLPRIEEAERNNARWETMHELIGSSAGDKFQLFAQSLTLDALLVHANGHLRELAPRYRLERAPGANLELQVIDRDMADEVRSLNSLSGGETFLVSLALALGLSALSARSTPVESLFIDEGFGTLDPQTLDTALATLDALQAAGRKVGLISHVPGMAERIGVQVRVAPQGSGSSRVQVLVS